MDGFSLISGAAPRRLPVYDNDRNRLHPLLEVSPVQDFLTQVDPERVNAEPRGMLFSLRFCCMIFYKGIMMNVDKVTYEYYSHWNGAVMTPQKRGVFLIHNPQRDIVPIRLFPVNGCLCFCK
jgi:hypothetical protein